MDARLPVIRKKPHALVAEYSFAGRAVLAILTDGSDRRRPATVLDR
tara:strand:- start:140 stop:277 length:138 start_codon:yes stop_codon:yes gene_type:complete